MSPSASFLRLFDSLDFQSLQCTGDLEICTGGEKAFKSALPAASAGDRPHEALHLHQVHGLHLPGLREVNKTALLEVPPRPRKVPGSVSFDTVVPIRPRFAPHC